MNMSGQWELTERALAAGEASSADLARRPTTDTKASEEEKAGATHTDTSAQQAIVRTCGICGESTEGTVEATAEWFADHRRTAHPELPELVPSLTARVNRPCADP
jgi:hypothetical protein